MAGQNSCGQSHHICHGALYRAAQAPKTGRGRNARELALPPTDRHIGRDAADRLESLETPDGCEDEGHLLSSEAALTQPPPTGRSKLRCIRQWTRCSGGAFPCLSFVVEARHAAENVDTQPPPTGRSEPDARAVNDWFCFVEAFLTVSRVLWKQDMLLKMWMRKP